MIGAREITRVHELLSGYSEHLSKISQIKNNSLFEKLRIEAFLSRAGLTRNAFAKILYRQAILFSVSAILALLSGKLIIFLLALPIALFEYYLLRARFFERSEKFERDYPAFLLSLSSAVRAGADPLVALCESRKLFKKGSVIEFEIAQVNTAIDSGNTEEEAIRCFGNSVKHPDVPLFSSAFLLARREGSSFSECLQRLARVTRQRQSFRRRIKASVAMQRFSAFGIAACATFIGFMQIIGNPEGLAALASSAVGVRVVIFGVTLVIAGIAWMVLLTRARI